MIRRFLAILLLFPFLLAQQCLEPLPHSSGTPLSWLIITTPDTKPTYTTSSTTLDLGGQAFSAAGVTEVTWSNDKGGSGACDGQVNWTASGIALQSGQNVITVTATDASSNTTIAKLTVTMQSKMAVAQGSQYVVPGVTATLDASGSLALSGGTITSNQWQQTAGSTVTLNNADQVRATYTVPDASGDLTFQLDVQDSLGNNDTASVTQTVLTSPKVKLETSMGTIVLDILRGALPEGAPNTATNFLQYVEDKFYNGTIFHRVVSGFVVQGGGFLPGATPQEGVRDPIATEFDSSRSNLRGTVAMAKGSDPVSTTSQFFFNLTDENAAQLDPQEFTVFAKVVEGMDVVDSMEKVETVDSTIIIFDNVPEKSYPVTDILLNRATVQP